MDVFIILLGLAILADHRKILAEGETDFMFRPSCNLTRWEISFPLLTDTRGATLPKSRLPEEATSDYIPKHLHVSLKWRRQVLNIALLQTHLVGGSSSAEWGEGNVTFSQRLEDKCFYHGYVKNKSPSHTALGICGGLAGFIQTPDEMLFIEPSGVTNQNTGLQAHVIYTCTRQVTDLTNDTSEPLQIPATGPQEILTEKTRHQRFRSKRATRKTKYVEAFVAVDTTVTAVVGKSRVNLYVMTLMNIVNAAYQHESLGIDIRVVVVRLLLLDINQEKQVISKNNPFGTVQKFCTWAMRYANHYDPQGHDIAILLTRENLGPAGYAPITGMCNPGRSCAAIKDEGFTSGFIIAHEMAHVFGLFHDGRGNPCTGSEYSTAIMARLVESKLNYYWWSMCSKKRMLEVIDYLYCLNDDPYQLSGLPEVPELIGTGWSLEHQCRLEFGEEFNICNAFHADPCGVLWCSKRRSPSLCRTKRGPALEGTHCGRDKTCIKGKCVYVGDLSPLDGNWADWSPWTKCTSDCGMGLRYRKRECNNPSPAYGGDTCAGEADITDVCKSNECKQYNDDRALQCSVWNDMRIRPGTHEWKPYTTNEKSDYCKSTCISEQTRETLTIDIDVEDGTPCTYGHSDNLCIHGKCTIVGCDGIINSTKASDQCGVCGGDGSQCKTVSGSYNNVPKAGDAYEQVIYVPRGATYIEVTKTSRSPHFISLKDPKYGVYYLNGDKRQMGSRSFIANGAVFDYKKGSSYESLVTEGPVRSDLEVMLFPNNYLQPASVTYQFTMDKNDHTLEKKNYKWKFSKWSECSVTCGTGTQQIIYACHDKKTEVRINDEMCSYLDTPRADVAMCYRPDCSTVDFNWVMLDDWSECSASCGENGLQKESYACEQHLEDDTYEMVDLELCSGIEAPNETRPCNVIQCTLDWTIEEWQECTVTCGDGFERRQVYCGIKDDASDDSLCIDEKPVSTRQCNLTECSLEWIVGDWQQCSKTCSTGIQKRDVYCGDRVDENDDYLCPEDKPTSAKFCNMGSCQVHRESLCLRDKYSFCRTANAKKCVFGGFKRICCKSCRTLAGAAYRRIAALRRFAKARRFRRRRMG
ncbi:A disintegrin and metalloproteinase with thrombospondin motifs 2 isoform X1 [Patella vulgata]|uniref:A disintegrin and metalloproteinase with thrombospondin motifs 2 isoform X1 n=2 Tax=Patella vulgata TaxID=6465 RepID=UPI0021800630|nr:A disintegrin and metalloproteinase with thrombospondin motifs 2 isoform X1 [Patella vulgata]